MRHGAGPQDRVVRTSRFPRKATAWQGWSRQRGSEGVWLTPQVFWLSFSAGSFLGTAIPTGHCRTSGACGKGESGGALSLDQPSCLGYWDPVALCTFPEASGPPVIECSGLGSHRLCFLPSSSVPGSCAFVGPSTWLGLARL